MPKFKVTRVEGDFMVESLSEVILQDEKIFRENGRFFLEFTYDRFYL